MSSLFALFFVIHDMELFLARNYSVDKYKPIEVYDIGLF
jgi:hypothetical protein